MLSECIYTSGGGGEPITISEISFTGKTLLHTISAYNTSWTATEDCIMGGKIKGGSGYSAWVELDGAMIWATGTGAESWIGTSTITTTTPSTYGFFIPKGATVKTRNHSSAVYDIKFYSIS